MTAYQDRIPIASTGSSANRAAPGLEPKSNELNGQMIKNAIAFNNSHWRDPHRSEILAKLRAAAGEPRFNETDVLAIAAMQKRERAIVDGRLSGPTMAALLRGGLHLSEVKAKPEEVLLVFYPGEFEDLAAWQKAKADAIAANGGHSATRSTERSRRRLGMERSVSICEEMLLPRSLHVAHRSR